MVGRELSYHEVDLMSVARDSTHPIVVTTNGFVKRNGECVMGAGIAKRVRDEIPGSASKLGALISEYGNRPFRLFPDVWTMPVKHKWMEDADLDLMRQSLELMVPMVAKFDIHTLYFPRPGSGNGKLDYFADGVDDLMREFHGRVGIRIQVHDLPRR